MEPIATPECIHFCNELSRSKNGKILRPVLKKKANWELKKIGDVTGLANSKAMRGILP